MAKALTVKQIEALKGGASRQEVPDGLLAGLYLVVQPSGAKSWAVRYRSAGQTRKLTLGQWPAIDLASARDLARKALVSVAEGRDPTAEKKAAKRSAADAASARDKVEDIVALFIERHAKANNRATTAKETERLLNKDVVPAWKGRRIHSITKRDVIDLLDEIVDRGAGIVANRTLAAMRKMFNWTIDRGIIESSPCDRVKAPNVERSRDRVLADDEINLVWRSAEKMGFPFGPMVQLLMLTGQRREEVGGMRWSELDLGKALWTIPGERTKNGQVHEVPLPPAAVIIIESLPRIASKAGLLFSTNGERQVSGYSKAKSRLDGIMLKTMREDAVAAGASAEEVAKIKLTDWRFHDLRRTAASVLARLSFSLPVIEKVLNHTSGSFSGVVGVYQRHSFAAEKRDALRAWAQFCADVGKPKPSNVVALRA